MLCILLRSWVTTQNQFRKFSLKDYNSTGLRAFKLSLNLLWSLLPCSSIEKKNANLSLTSLLLSCRKENKWKLYVYQEVLQPSRSWSVDKECWRSDTHPYLLHLRAFTSDPSRVAPWIQLPSGTEAHVGYSWIPTKQSFIRKESISCALQPICDANYSKRRQWDNSLWKSKLNPSRKLDVEAPKRYHHPEKTPTDLCNWEA